MLARLSVKGIFCLDVNVGCHLNFAAILGAEYCSKIETVTTVQVSVASETE